METLLSLVFGTTIGEVKERERQREKWIGGCFSWTTEDQELALYNRTIGKLILLAKLLINSALS